MNNDNQDSSDSREEKISNEEKKKEMRKKRQRIQFGITIAESDLNHAERKKEDLETDLAKLIKDQDAIVTSIDGKEREIKKLEDEMTFQQGEIDMMRKKMNILKED